MKLSEQTELVRGALYAVLAALAFSATGACVKFATADTDVPLAVFVRNLVALGLLAPIALRKRAVGLVTQRPGSHLLRAAFGISAMYCFFYALSVLGLAEAMLLNYSTPLFIPLVAWLWIGERPPLVIIPVVLLGLVGIILISDPGSWRNEEPLAGTNLARLIGLASGLLAAFAMVGIRRMTDTEPAVRIVFYFSLLATLVTALPAISDRSMPSAPTWAAMIGAGALAMFGQLALTRAYALGTAARIGAIAYCVVIFAAGWGWLFWNEVPSAQTISGACLVIAACYLASYSRPRTQ